jgi:hypothetical protein
MATPPQLISHPLTVYLGLDGSIWAMDLSDYRAYQVALPSASGTQEAPIDGQLYGRKNAAWALAPADGGVGGVAEAPADGQLYGRQNAGWAAVPSGGADSYYTETWNWTTKTTDAAASGQVGNNVTDWNAAFININEKTSGNRDMTPAFGDLFVQGNQLLIQQKTDATKFGRYTISGSGADMGNWWQFPVTLTNSGGTPPAGNADTLVTVLVKGGGGGLAEAPADGQLYGRLNSAWAAEHNIGRVMFDTPAAIAGTETSGTRITAAIPASMLPPKPFNFIIDNFYLYNTVNPSPGSTGTWAFGLLADLSDGSGPIWRTVTNFQDLSASGIAFAAGVLHKYLSLSPVSPNSGLWYTGGGSIQFALVCGTTPPSKADSSLRMGIALRPLYY